jgi:hypothetical protein
MRNMLRKLTVLLSALSMMLVMAAPPAMAAAGGSCGGLCGHQADDGPDKNKGGGNEHIKTNNGKGND